MGGIGRQQGCKDMFFACWCCGLLSINKLLFYGKNILLGFLVTDEISWGLVFSEVMGFRFYVDQRL